MYVRLMSGNFAGEVSSGRDIRILWVCFNLYVKVWIF